MAKGHSGNAFSSDFTTLFSGIAPETSSIKEVEEKPITEPEATKNSSSKTKEKQTVAKPKKKEVKKEKAVPTPTPVKESSITKAVESQPQVIKNPKSLIAAANNEVYINVYMTSKDERDYLKFRSTELDMTTSEFFMSLIKSDSDMIKANKVDYTDQKHIDFKQQNLSVSTSIKVTNDIKNTIKKNAVRHRLSAQRYCAYIVQQALENDADWY